MARRKQSHPAKGRTDIRKRHIRNRLTDHNNSIIGRTAQRLFPSLCTISTSSVLVSPIFRSAAAAPQVSSHPEDAAVAALLRREEPASRYP